MGIFSQPLNGKVLPTPSEYIVQPKDRVEIYRPLLADPKQARLRRAKNKEMQQDKGSA
jgi:putative ubiquitin-RnfH superfamily antitoxin RatB of RatAB toxin-antitoxin module